MACTEKTDQKKNASTTDEQMRHAFILTAYILTWQEAYGMEILQPKDSVVLAHAAAD